MTTIHVMQIEAPGHTGMLILGVPGTVSAQKFIDLGLYGDARQYLAELGYMDPIVGQVRVTIKEFKSFFGLGAGVELPRAESQTTTPAEPWKQEPYQLGGAYGYWYAELHNPDDASDSGSYGITARGARKLAQEVVNELNHAFRCGRTGQPLHRGMESRPPGGRRGY